MPKMSKLELMDAPPPLLFEGFSRETFRLLHDLKENNNKPWFDEHRSEYESLLREPCRGLVEQMALLFAEHGLPLRATPKASLFRINRDIRFSKDKSPYKTHIGIAFPFEGVSQEEWRGMYFSLEPEGKKGIKSYCGGGVYVPSSAMLKRIREKVAIDHATFDRLLAEPGFHDLFPGGIHGESLKRMPKGYAEDHPASRYLKMKQFLFGAPLTEEHVLSRELPEILIDHCKAGIDVLELLGA